MICVLCNRRIHHRTLGLHLYFKHKWSYKNNCEKYYYNFLKKENEGICLVCNKKTSFDGILLGYNKYCSLNCAQTIIYKKRSLKTKLEYLKESKKIHKNKYDYSLVEWNGVFDKIKIECPIHGIFLQTPDSHKRGAGCPKCGCENNRTIKLKIGKNNFYKNASIIHDKKYDYNDSVYKGMQIKVKIKCPIHGYFYQRPLDHLKGNGCNSCNDSHGERRIRSWLNKNNIKYTHQKTFKECKYKKQLKFDFYLKKYNLCIEFDGEQHYGRLPKNWGNNYKNIKIRDKIKNMFCINNKVRLVRISYKDYDNIERILNKVIYGYKQTDNKGRLYTSN